MNVARPIRKEEYEVFRKELYIYKDGAESASRYAVSLDEDPTLRPKDLSKKLAEVQANKDRLVVMLNRAILNDAYWKTISKRIEARFESETNKAYLDEQVKSLKNQELRQGQASVFAAKAVVDALFDGKGVYEDQTALVYRNWQDALAFLGETKNIYESVDKTSFLLALQLKSVMVNMRISGDPSEDAPTEQQVSVGR